MIDHESRRRGRMALDNRYLARRVRTVKQNLAVDRKGEAPCAAFRRAIACGVVESNLILFK
jgi:hypothetical protein